MAYVCDLVIFNTPCVSLAGEQEWGKDLDETYQVGVTITLFRTKNLKICGDKYRMTPGRKSKY